MAIDPEILPAYASSHGTLINGTRDERKIIALEVLSEIVPSSLR